MGKVSLVSDRARAIVNGLSNAISISAMNDTKERLKLYVRGRYPTQATTLLTPEKLNWIDADLMTSQINPDIKTMAEIGLWVLRLAIERKDEPQDFILECLDNAGELEKMMQVFMDKKVQIVVYNNSDVENENKKVRLTDPIDVDKIGGTSTGVQRKFRFAHVTFNEKTGKRRRKPSTTAGKRDLASRKNRPETTEGRAHKRRRAQLNSDDSNDDDEQGKKSNESSQEEPQKEDQDDSNDELDALLGEDGNSAGDVDIGGESDGDPPVTITSSKKDKKTKKAADTSDDEAQKNPLLPVKGARTYPHIRKIQADIIKPGNEADYSEFWPEYFRVMSKRISASSSKGDKRAEKEQMAGQLRAQYQALESTITALSEDCISGLPTY
jgi:hypothetical protein